MFALMVATGGAFAAYRWSPAKTADPAPTTPVPAAAAVPAVDGAALIKEAKENYFTANTPPTKGTDQGRDLMKHALNLAYRAYKLNPVEPAPLKLMGLCNEGLGNTQDAIDNYGQYVKAQPPPPDVSDIRKRLAALEQDLPGK